MLRVAKIYLALSHCKFRIRWALGIREASYFVKTMLNYKVG